MKIYFLRHGEAEHNVSGTFSIEDIDDTGLTESGVKEVIAAADVLAELGITRIYSSDYLRAKQTTAIVNEKLKLDSKNIKYDVRLREIFVGDLRGMIIKNSPKDYLDNPHKYNSENLEDIYNRVRSIIYDIRTTEDRNAVILLSGHDVANSVLMYCACEGTDKPFDEEKCVQVYFERLTNASITMVDMNIKQERKVQLIHGGKGKDPFDDKGGTE